MVHVRDSKDTPPMHAVFLNSGVRTISIQLAGNVRCVVAQDAIFHIILGNWKYCSVNQRHCISISRDDTTEEKWGTYP